MEACLRRLVLLVLPALVLGCGGSGDSLTRGAASALAGAAARLLGTPADPQRAPTEEPSGDPAAPAADPAPEAASPRADAADAAAYYRYVEPGGSIRFVERLDEVPAALRASAQPVAGAGARPSSRGPSRPAPRLAERPFARTAAAPAPRRAAEVTVYTTAWCGWCRKTLAWLDDRGVAYVNKDIEANDAYRDELAEKTGGSVSIPVVEIGGELVRGFDPAALERLL